MHGHEFSLGMLLLLGAAHGINPAMGWLFAVSLGLQEQRRTAVWAALGPLALGHAAAIAVVIALATALGLVIPLQVVKWLAAATLLGFGVLHLIRHPHPRGGGMRVGAKDLTIWSFLMASAHGAGVMALPLALRLSAPPPAAAAATTAMSVHSAHPAALASVVGIDPSGLLATSVHTLGYLAVAGCLAVIVYEKLGLRLLRSAWINLQLIWAASLIVAGILTPWL